MITKFISIFACIVSVICFGFLFVSLFFGLEDISIILCCIMGISGVIGIVTDRISK